ncbi:hypothetical protein QVD17_11486 [Tagetes erecta]|uniref:Aluminum-activated malate transporter n=1 Tax=Tagetes erecta TaxID=13708 RepID=A0AAD8L0T2_TARER|nr:hypothetical protein QVD17_11486 [Tagetes erecta]
MENGFSLSLTTLFSHLKTISSPSKIKHDIVDFAINIKSVAVHDPRRIAHSLKVALAITLVSITYFLEPFYNIFSDAGIWAIITVAMVFEYTVGATLSKGLNRAFATLLAGALGLGADSFASLFGQTVKPIILGFFVFLIVALATFSRFIPNIKKRYDYGMSIFMLTFILVSVSGSRVDSIIKLAHQRLTAIVFGGVIGILISLCVLPVWAGEGLHKLIVKNLEELAKFLEGFGGVYYRISNGDKLFFDSYKSVLNSKATDEQSLANSAWWEIGHGKFQFRHPWTKYLEIGDCTRQCAYHIEALNGYLEEKYAPSEFQETVKEPCMKMSSEVGKALKELGSSMKLMICPSSSYIHIKNCKIAIEELNTTLKVSMVADRCDVLEAIPVIAATSILVEIIACVETMSKAIEELSKQAHFQEPKCVTLSEQTEKPHYVDHGFALGGKYKETIIVTVL